jgi:hypothetical protein
MGLVSAATFWSSALLRRFPGAVMLPFYFQIRARLDVIRPGLELFHAHLFQEPASFDFLRGHYLKAFDELRIPVVPLHAHQGQ